MFNPIPSRPNQMNLAQVETCIEVLGMVFDTMERGCDKETVVTMLDQARKQMIQKWK